MDAVDRAVNLTKAKMLELYAAYLRIMVDGPQAPRTYEGLMGVLRRTISDMEEDCKAFREAVPPDPSKN